MNEKGMKYARVQWCQSVLTMLQSSEHNGRTLKLKEQERKHKQQHCNAKPPALPLSGTTLTKQNIQHYSARPLAPQCRHHQQLHQTEAVASRRHVANTVAPPSKATLPLAVRLAVQC
ncbi:Uncharacterized protein TCM_002467 [Theobroma cacao]|uniref:Uncharacterized protein n=1 Tax=Theobroma cacao TaxID=3641 RepID=A0A061DLL4_THECC|nr:Uncharacterized protein TCM_002467 [Theobroma cacao]